MKETSWNHVIWLAIKNLKENSKIDELFLACEKDLYNLKAPRKETELRLFALAHYCNNMYNRDFFKSLAYLRFEPALDFSHFERIAKTLISENSLAIVVFWVIFRLSFKNSLPRSCYLQMETKMKNKSLQLGENFVY